MPLGFKSLRRMMQIIREEMDAIGGQEFLLPVLHPAEIWRRSGRYDIDAVFKLQDRSGRDLVLAITHEEIVAFHAATEIRSYRDLPQIRIHQQTKERDEPRPQGGLLRTREFIMKDSYTLDRDRAGLDEGYAKHEIAYARIFDRAGLDWYKVESDVGMMGGFGAHEYMAPSPVGEDRIALAEDGSYGANLEVAVSVAHPPAFPPQAPAEEVETPGVATIAELAQYLGIDERLTVKAVMVVPEDERGGVVLALVRGDHRVHDLKLAKALGTPFRAATPEEIREAFGADPGSIGAVGVREGALREIVADEVLREGAYVAGANRDGWHLRNVELGRDYQARVADIRFVEEGELAVGTGSPLRIVTAIEVGNIFKLGTRYSEKFGATYLDENGAEQPIWMGSYGIGAGPHGRVRGRAAQRRARHRMAARGRAVRRVDHGHRRRGAGRGGRARPPARGPGPDGAGRRPAAVARRALRRRGSRRRPGAGDDRQATADRGHGRGAAALQRRPRAGRAGRRPAAHRRAGRRRVAARGLAAQGGGWPLGFLVKNSNCFGRSTFIVSGSVRNIEYASAYASSGSFLP